MKKNHSLFTILFTIYIAAGILSVILFATKGSYLSHEQAASATDPVQAVTPDQPEAPEIPAISEEPQKSDTPEISDEPENAPEPDTTERPQVPDTPEEPENTPEPTISEDPQTPDDEASEVKTGDDGKIYYGFTVIDDVTDVRIHKTKERDSETISYIDGGKSGYVLERGDTRSKILTKKGTIGYIYNEYITISEIPGEEFPEEYR